MLTRSPFLLLVRSLAFRIVEVEAKRDMAEQYATMKRRPLERLARKNVRSRQDSKTEMKIDEDA